MKNFFLSKLFFLCLLGTVIFSNVHCANYKSSIGKKSKILKTTQDQTADGQLAAYLMFVAHEKDYLKGSYSISQSVLLSKRKNGSNYTTKDISNFPAALKASLNEAKSVYHIKIEIEGIQSSEVDLLKAAGKEQSLLLGGDPFAFEIKFTCDLKNCDIFYMSILTRDLKPKRLNDTFKIALPPVKLWLNEKNQLMGAIHDFYGKSIVYDEAVRTNPYYFLKNISEFDTYEWTPLTRWN